jgi:hypothetical protein
VQASVTDDKSMYNNQKNAIIKQHSSAYKVRRLNFKVAGTLNFLMFMRLTISHLKLSIIKASG